MKNKLFLTLSLIAAASTATNMHADENDSWWQYFVACIWGNDQEMQAPKQQPPQQYQRPVPSAPPLDTQSSRPATQTAPQGITNAQLAQVQRDTEEIIDRLFATREQESGTQREIYGIKQATINCINQHNKQCKTVQELRNTTNYYLVECLARVMAQHARSLYEQKAAKAHGQPPYAPHEMANKTEAAFKDVLLAEIRSNRPGTLAGYVGQRLHALVAERVAHDYPTPAPIPSAPPQEAVNEIYEIYPNSKATRYEQTIAKIQQGKVHRQGDCCSCMEDFGGTKMRVTLACGHSICPDCLYNWLHQQHKNTCPVCRDTIHTDEFPVSYLNQYVN